LKTGEAGDLFSDGWGKTKETATDIGGFLVEKTGEAADFVGYPEARIVLAQATIYVACAPKSNASIVAIDEAIEDIKKERTQEVPKHLKDGHYSKAKELGKGVGYKYAHSYEGNYVKQDYLENRKKYYYPTDNGYEKKIKEWLNSLTDKNDDKRKEQDKR